MASSKAKKIGYRAGVISTFGIVYWITKARAKRLSKKVNTNLTSSGKIDFMIDSIVKTLGSKTNIKDVSSTLSSVNIVLDDIKKVDERELKKYGVQGVLKRANKLTLIFGDNAPAIKKVITDLISISDAIPEVADKIVEAKEKLVS